MELFSENKCWEMFLRFIDTPFTADNPLRKLFNRNTVKISYKCMPNMASLVSSHNTRMLQKDPQQQEPQGCNCRGGPANCPLTPAECQKNNVIYVASVESQPGRRTPSSRNPRAATATDDLPTYSS